MRAINLFILTRIIGEGETGLEDKLVSYERLLSDRDKKPEVHNKKKIIDEIKIIRRIVDIF